MDQTAPPIEFILKFCFVIGGIFTLIVLLSAYAKNAGKADQEKRNKVCQDEQRGLLIQIEGSATRTDFSFVENEVEDFVHEWKGRVPAKLYSNLVSELHAALHNKARQFQGFTVRTNVSVKTRRVHGCFPFWL